MCGIAGVWGAADVQQMLSAIAHRGPDACGTHESTDPHATLGACRLRILDLSPAADQPIVDGDLAIAYNGEVFNAPELRVVLGGASSFKTTCDTEVVLRAWRQWGPDCQKHMIGQWAFAILNSRTKTLYLARDRMGEKPLYWTRQGDRVLFASEIKALLAVTKAAPRIPDIWWTLEKCQDGDTLVDGINELPAGCWMSVDAAGVHGPFRYWEPPPQEETLRTENDLAEELRALLTDAVRLRLRADVPVGIALSGGVDSAAIAALTGQKGLRAYTCRFQLGAGYDESEYASITAAHNGLIQTVIEPTAEDMHERLPSIIAQLDQPVATASPIGAFAIARAASHDGVKVLLGGQGSDEVFGGYTRNILFAAEREVVNAPTFRNYGGLINSLWGDGAAGDPAARYLRLLARRAGPGVEPALAAMHDAFAGRDDINGACMADFRWVLPPLIRMDDRASAAVGVENRSPFLDHRLVEFGMRLPGRFKIRGNVGKVLLRRALRGLVHDAILDRADKKGLVVPFVPWLTGPLHSWTDELLTSLHARGIRPPEPLLTRGAFDRSMYMLLTLELWFRRFFPAFSAP
jgi:asparagine synthase (glutamine-hydrolysing)